MRIEIMYSFTTPVYMRVNVFWRKIGSIERMRTFLLASKRYKHPLLWE